MPELRVCIDNDNRDEVSAALSRFVSQTYGWNLRVVSVSEPDPKADAARRRAQAALDAAQAALDAAITTFGSASVLDEPAAIRRIAELREQRDVAAVSVRPTPDTLRVNGVHMKAGESTPICWLDHPIRFDGIALEGEGTVVANIALREDAYDSIVRCAENDDDEAGRLARLLVQPTPINN